MSDWHRGHNNAGSTLSVRHFLKQGFLPVMSGAPALIKEQEDEGHLKKKQQLIRQETCIHNTLMQVHTEEKLTCPYMLTTLRKKHVISRHIHHTSVQPLIKMGTSPARCLSNNGLCVWMGDFLPQKHSLPPLSPA